MKRANAAIEPTEGIAGKESEEALPTHLMPVRLACHDCDTLFAFVPPGRDERALCPYCGCLLMIRRPRTIQRSAAWALGAAALFFVANFFPFLTLEAAGQRNEIVLAQTVGALYQEDSFGLAVAVAVFILGAPTFIVAGSLYVLFPLLLETRNLPGARFFARSIAAVSRWNMTEVFLLGVLVSLLKLTELASVTVGIAFWGFVAMIVCLTASLAAIDRRRLWDGIEPTSDFPPVSR